MKGDLKHGVVLFADLAGSTSLYASLGNVAAADAVRTALLRMSQFVEGNGGKVVKTVGDAVLAWFADADGAANAAVAIQRGRDQKSLPVRVGFHYGEAVHEHADIFGDAVNVAARLVSRASGGEILVSRASVTLLSEPLAKMARTIGTERFKGMAQPMQVFQLLWDQDRNVTRAVRIGPAPDAAIEEMCALRLTFRGRLVVVTPRSMPFTFGRDKKASLPVSSDLVSRSHARLEFHHGKFVLFDQSTNGTFVTPYGATEVQLRRDSMPLLGHGVFALGGSALRNPEVAVQYVTE